MRAYYLFGRLIRPFMVIALYAYSYTFRIPRARVVLQNEEGEILFIQSWLSRGEWGLPGGGLDKGEDAVHAAAREVEEEVGIELEPRSLRSLFIIKFAGHDEIVFLATAQKSDLSNELPNKYEIKNAAWFPMSGLPQLEPLPRRIINRVIDKT